MKQTLHALVVDVERRRVLAATYGSTWLLPVLTCDERARPLPMVANWLADRGIDADVSGQWLGRVTNDSIDWLVAIAAEARNARTAEGLVWYAPDALASSRPVVEYQRWALVRTLTRGFPPTVDGPFGHLCWPHEVRRWIGAVSGPAAGSLTPYRCAAHEVVVGAQCGLSRVFFKGLTQDRAGEVQTTRTLAGVEPGSFARTIAEAGRQGCTWWLTAECAGRASRDLQCVAQALSRIQQRVLALGPAGVSLRQLELDAAERWASDLLGDSPQRDVLDRACARVRGADVPTTWIPMDLDPSNVLVDEANRARFIDVDDSFLGPAPLAMATLLLRCGDRALCRTYERSWSPPLTGLDWPAFETAAAVIHAWLGWTRLERNVARGEIVVDRGFASSRARARLSKAIDAISSPPARRAGPAA